MNKYVETFSIFAFCFIVSGIGASIVEVGLREGNLNKAYTKPDSQLINGNYLLKVIQTPCGRYFTWVHSENNDFKYSGTIKNTKTHCLINYSYNLNGVMPYQ